MSDVVRVILGYVLFFGYMFLEIVVVEAIQKKFDLDKELMRKVGHIFTGLCWVIAYFFLGWTIHLFIVNAVALLLLCIITFGDLMKSVERDDMGKSYGVVYFGASTLVVVAIVVFVNKSLFAYYGIAYYCLVLADGLAPIVARLFKKRNLSLVHGKTLAGTATVFLTSALIAFVFSLIFSLHFSALLIFSFASLVAMAELFGAKGTDNFTIVFFAFGYLLLAHYGYLDLGMQIVILLMPVLTLFSIKAKALTPWAQTVSYLILLAFTLFGGYRLAVLVIALFAVAAVVTKVSSRLFSQKTNAPQKTARKSIQILANSSVAVSFAIAYFFSGAKWLLFVAFVVIIEEFADSMSSDVGRLAKNPPVDILRFKRVPAGTSGGVSLLGTVTALVAAFLAGLLALAFFKDPLLYVAISGAAFLGTIADSVLGSAFQGLFECPVCGAITEKKVHCDVPAKLIKGFAAVDNSLVNFLSSAVAAGIASVVLLFSGIL